MKKFTTPYNEDSEILSHFDIKAQQRYALNIAKNMDEIIEPVADIGIYNLKSEIIKTLHRVDVQQIGQGRDWNRKQMDIGGFGTVTFFDSLEHLLNPLFFMDGMNSILKPGGLLYVCLPQRPSWLWTDHHFHEIDDSRCEYLFREAGFDIEKRVKISFWRWKPGLRPLTRFFYDKSMFYKLRKK